jgi:hypothetical protein
VPQSSVRFQIFRILPLSAHSSCCSPCLNALRRDRTSTSFAVKPAGGPQRGLDGRLQARAARAAWDFEPSVGSGNLLFHGH